MGGELKQIPCGGVSPIGPLFFRHGIVTGIAFESDIFDNHTAVISREDREVRAVIDAVPPEITLVPVLNVVLKQEVSNDFLTKRLKVCAVKPLPWH
jgi:hypothetical protein